MVRRLSLETLHFKVISKHFAQSQENDVKKDEEGIQQNPSDIKE